MFLVVARDIAAVRPRASGREHSLGRPPDDRHGAPGVAGGRRAGGVVRKNRRSRLQRDARHRMEMLGRGAAVDNAMSLTTIR